MKTRRSKVYQSSDEKFSQLVENSKSICDIAKKIGLSVIHRQKLFVENKF